MLIQKNTKRSKNGLHLSLLMKTTTHIRGLDALRAISILFVILNHAGIGRLMTENSFVAVHVYPLFSGEAGVRIFFVISGFLITHLLVQEKKAHGRINMQNFFIRRFLKLFPPLIILFSILLLFIALDWSTLDWYAIGMAFFFLFNYVPFAHYLPELAHMWSLGVEEQFYVFWSICIAFSNRIQTWPWIAGACILLSLLVPLTYEDDFFENAFLPNRWFFPASAPIFIGCIAALLNHRRDNRAVSLPNQRVLIMAAILCYFNSIFVGEYSPHVSEMIQATGVALFIVWITHNQWSGAVDLLEVKWLRFIGKISYGLYVYQGIFLLTGPGSELKIRHLPIALPLLCVLAVVSYYFIEKPVLTWKEKFR